MSTKNKAETPLSGGICGVKSKTLDKSLKAIAAGSVMVALSGIVPTPLVSGAHAATATINAVGTFSGGITLGAGTNIVFGPMVATSNTGKMTVTPGSATGTSNGFFNGVPAAGSLTFKASAGGLPVNVSVSGFTTSFALTDKGQGTQGSITIGQASFSGPFTAAVVVKAATPNKVATLNNATTATVPTDVNAGAVVSWNGARPIGGFSVPLTVTIAY